MKFGIVFLFVCLLCLFCQMVAKTNCLGQAVQGQQGNAILFSCKGKLYFLPFRSMFTALVSSSMKCAQVNG